CAPPARGPLETPPAPTPPRGGWPPIRARVHRFRRTERGDSSRGLGSGRPHRSDVRRPVRRSEQSRSPPRESRRRQRQAAVFCGGPSCQYSWTRELLFGILVIGKASMPRKPNSFKLNGKVRIITRVEGRKTFDRQPGSISR